MAEMTYLQAISDGLRTEMRRDKRVFLIGIALFSAASLLCGLAPSAQALYVARALQGVGAAFQLAPALANIGHAFHDEHERARAWATWGTFMGMTMVTAPLITTGSLVFSAKRKCSPRLL